MNWIKQETAPSTPPPFSFAAFRPLRKDYLASRCITLKVFLLDSGCFESNGLVLLWFTDSCTTAEQTEGALASDGSAPSTVSRPASGHNYIREAENINANSDVYYVVRD